jgi:hypothetical protein
VPSPSAFFKRILEVKFYEGLSMWFCLDHLSCDKMAASQFYLKSGNQESRVGGDYGYVFGQKFPGEKVRRCVVMMPWDSKNLQIIDTPKIYYQVCKYVDTFPGEKINIFENSYKNSVIRNK